MYNTNENFPAQNFIYKEHSHFVHSTPHITFYAANVHYLTSELTQHRHFIRTILTQFIQYTKLTRESITPKKVFPSHAHFQTTGHLEFSILRVEYFQKAKSVGHTHTLTQSSVVDRRLVLGFDTEISLAPRSGILVSSGSVIACCVPEDVMMRRSVSSSA